MLRRVVEAIFKFELLSSWSSISGMWRGMRASQVWQARYSEESSATFCHCHWNRWSLHRKCRLYWCHWERHCHFHWIHLYTYSPCYVKLNISDTKSSNPIANEKYTPQTYIYVVLIFEVVINTEWGALGNTGSLDFVRTRWDHAVDAGSKNFGKQVFISAVICLLMFIFCFVVSCVQNFSWTG